MIGTEKQNLLCTKKNHPKIKNMKKFISINESCNTWNTWKWRLDDENKTEKSSLKFDSIFDQCVNSERTTK